MSFWSRPGEPARVTFYNLPSGLAGTLGVRVLQGATVILGRTTAGVAELVPGLGAYVAEVTLEDAGTYQVVIDDGSGIPSGAAVQTLTVAAAPLLGGPPLDAPTWAPSVVQIAIVSPSYTRGGFDDDEPQAGAEQGVFTDSTSPTVTEVERLIVQACAEVQGRVGFTVPERCHDLARMAATWWVAAAISAGKLPAQSDDAQGEHRAHTGRYLATLEELIYQARQPRALRVT